LSTTVLYKPFVEKKVDELMLFYSFCLERR